MDKLKQLELYQLMKHPNYLEKLTIKLSEYCNNPVLTMDYLHQVRSFHGEGNNNSITWNEMIQLGYLNANRIEEFFHITMKELIEKQKPLRIHYENDTMVLVPVIQQGLFMGLIAVLELSHQLNDEEIGYIKIMADILSLHCNEDITSITVSEYNHHHIIVDLLNEKIENQQKLYDRMKARKWQRANQYQLIISNISNHQESYQNYIINNISSIWNQCKALIYKGYLVVLIEVKNTNITNKVINYLRNYYLKLGVSDLFEDLFELRFYYHQAKKVLIYKENSNNQINTYDEVRLSDFFYECQKINKLNTFYHPDIIRLIEYDKINSTNYYETLCHYYDADKNLLMTSKMMNVHKNTIVYRIQKIKDMYPKIFENMNQEFHVKLTIQLLK